MSEFVSGIASQSLQVWRFSQIDNIPKSSGVYFVMKDTTILYIGMTIDVNKRIRTHNLKSKFLDHQANLIIFFEINDSKDRINSENVAIARFKPILNNGGRFQNAK